MNFKNYRNAAISSIIPEDKIFKTRIETARVSTIPSSLRKCYDTGRIEAFRLNWKPGMPDKPHIYWDSDVAKVLEGMANMLSIHPDPEMEREYDAIVDLIVASQQPDGYLNSHFTVVRPDERWSNLANHHELYCAGHLMEAAVAGYQLLGKRKLLDSMKRYAELIIRTFGRAPGQKRGYPGHQEIELALVRMYEASGEKRYFDLAKYFVDERGQRPNYFSEVEKTISMVECENRQAEAPVREQKDAHGHAVRAVYNYCGMIDVARHSNDDLLFEACQRLFDNLVNRRMYITGGIGSCFQGEAITIDFDLENGSLMYAESCAAMGLVRFASRMLNATGEGRYAEIVEKAIFNGVLAGISLSGNKFFYTNYLEVDANTKCHNEGAKERREWFNCSCCPTSFCRFIPESIQYIWSETATEIRLHLPVACTYNSPFGRIKVESDYPYDGRIRVLVEEKGDYVLSIRIPEWCTSYSCFLNGQAYHGTPVNGYISIDRSWNSADVLEYNLEMPVRIMRTNFKVTNNAGRIALMRGPLVYACESIDNPRGVANMLIRTRQEFQLATAEGLPEGTVAIVGKAWSESTEYADDLYFEGDITRVETTFTAIPYFLWQNRAACSMAVWIRADDDEKH